ncbi:L-rhamnose/proton symporter RhaT [uncultured Aquimarina sp.]|uniref:L-rhamnose/proton symporter RhaT n=1 Tax=uncultured Aquimarina sp. TaxID=575652 RepID=UPI00260A156C|nr:L-rhamnose/proton symporter RhaT [uncultured Aquimarina sp.]
MYIFSDKTYYVTLGMIPLILTLENLNKKPAEFLKNGIICLLIFGISLIGISAIDANIKVMECTACDDGIRKIHWNGINYGLIIGTSAIISIIPSLIRIIKRIKKTSVQHDI